MALWINDLHYCASCSSLLQIDSSSKELAEEKHISENALKRQKQDPVPCQYCIDLLSPHYQQLIIDSIVQHLTVEKYADIQSFQLCISIPPSLILHQGIIEMCTNKDNICKGLFDFVKDQLKCTLIEAVSSRIKLVGDKNSPFHISVLLSHFEIDKRYEVLASKTKKKHKKRKPFCFTQEFVRGILETTPYTEMMSTELMPTPEKAVDELCHFDIKCNHESLYLAGRYNKYSRTLSQSPWIIDGVKKASTSVQEIIHSHVTVAFRPDTIKFASSGREDVDVRMLGSGRPFLLEIVNPRKVTFNDSECADVCKSINGSTRDIAVNNIKMVDRATVNILKAGEEEKEKYYSALIWSSKPLTDGSILFLNNITDLTITQKTPIRVLHRRSLASRQRIIHTLHVNLIDDHHFRLDLSTQAGTYIKEFVHGDFGRTLPNLCELMGHQVDIVVLDVTDILLEWPPP